METTIFYFTGTGNSLWTAEYLASKLGNTKLVSLPLAEGVNISGLSSQRIGFVFPVIMFGLPLIIKRFIETIPISNDTYYFAIATCGGMPFSTLKQMERLFSIRGGKLSAGFSVTLVNNCTSIGEAIKEDKQRQRFKNSIRSLNQIIEKIEKEKKYVEKGTPGLNWYFSGILHKKAESMIPDAAKYFYTDEKCNGCGLCTQVCPVDNISMESGKPCWSAHCEQCYACLQWCPLESVQVKNKKTEGLRRYHCPEIKLVDVIRR